MTTTTTPDIASVREQLRLMIGEVQRMKGFSARSPRHVDADLARAEAALKLASWELMGAEMKSNPSTDSAEISSAMRHYRRDRATLLDALDAASKEVPS